MNQQREAGTCALFRSAAHGGREVVYAAGGQNSANTAEILDYTQTETWEQIDNLPWGTTYGPRALTNMEGTGVYHFYGRDYTELTCDTSKCSFSPRVTLTQITE